MINVCVVAVKNTNIVVESRWKMNKEFQIKVISGYEKNIFFKEDNQLDIVGNIDNLSMYPIKIELRTYEEEQDGELIATIYGYYFDMDYIYNQNISPFEIFDSYSQDTYELYEALFKDNQYKEELEVFNPNLFYLDNIFVEENYRQYGYCKMLVNQLDEILKYIAKLNVGIIVTEIYSFETNDEIDPIEELTDTEKQQLNQKLKNLFINNDYLFIENNDNYLVKVLS